MNDLPEFWRTEVFHPLSVHFPIALLLVGFVFKLISLKFKREVWELGGTILLLTGVLGVWIATYTGNLADGIVSRKICDPTILKDHQNMAYVTSWIFTAALAADSLKYLRNSFLAGKRKILSFLVALLMLGGSGFLIYVGHLGAELVYQQGAGVYMPAEDCREFE